MDLTLQEIRASFGYSQEQLSAQLGKDVSTISRWERNKSQEPLISPLFQSANRKYQYVKSMMDTDIANYVYKTDNIAGLFFGSDLMIMVVSQYALKRYPLLRAAYGFSASSYFRGEGKKLFDANIENTKKALVTPCSSAICKVPPKSGLIITDGLTVDFKFIGQNLIHVEARSMSQDELDACSSASIEFTFG